MIDRSPHKGCEDALGDGVDVAEVGRPPVTEVLLELHLSVLRDDEALQMAKLRSGDGILESLHRQASKRRAF
jgi:hypothetical protein